MRPIPAPIHVVCLLLLLVPLYAPEARGQQIPSPYSFIETRHETSFLAGWALENRGQLDLGPGGGPVVGGRYAIELGGAFALEGTGLLLFTDRQVFDPVGEDAPLLLGTTSSVVGSMDGRIRFSFTGPRTWHGLSPFLMAGGGLATDFRRVSGLDEEIPSEARFQFGPSFMGVLGGGTRWFPADRIGFRLEAVLHIWKLGTPTTYFDLEEELGSVPDQEWTGVGTIILGGSLHF